MLASARAASPIQITGTIFFHDRVAAHRAASFETSPEARTATKRRAAGECQSV